MFIEIFILKCLNLHTYTSFWVIFRSLLETVGPSEPSFSEKSLAIVNRKHTILEYTMQDRTFQNVRWESEWLRWDILLHYRTHPVLHLRITTCSDPYNIFSAKKNENVECVQNALPRYVTGKPEHFYRFCIGNLLKRWRQVVDNDGDYTVGLK